MKDEIIIAGAGIAGLTAALTLAQNGVPSLVIEAFDKPSEVGAGIQVPPNATRVLSKLNVLDDLKSRALMPDGVALADALTGKVLAQLPVRGRRFGNDDAPWMTAHRAVLHGVLHDAAKGHPQISFLHGHRIEDIRQSENAATLTLVDSVGTTSTLDAGFVIGADGIWSVCRRAVPGASKPVATGRLAMRAVVPADADERENRVVAWLAPSSHLVTYPMRNAETRNIVAIVPGTTTSGSWDEATDDQSLLALTRALERTIHGPLVRSVKWRRWPLFSVNAAGQWVHGRVALIGDAAHGLEPFAAQGAAMAVEDGYTLGVLLARERRSHAEAAARFHAMRLPRVKRVAARTEFNRRTYHMDGPARLVRNFVISKRDPASLLADLDWLYGFDATGT